MRAIGFLLENRIGYELLTSSAISPCLPAVSSVYFNKAIMRLRSVTAGYQYGGLVRVMGEVRHDEKVSGNFVGAVADDGPWLFDRLSVGPVYGTALQEN